MEALAAWLAQRSHHSHATHCTSLRLLINGMAPSKRLLERSIALVKVVIGIEWGMGGGGHGELEGSPFAQRTLPVHLIAPHTTAEHSKFPEPRVCKGQMFPKRRVLTTHTDSARGRRALGGTTQPARTSGWSGQQRWWGGRAPTTGSSTTECFAGLSNPAGVPRVGCPTAAFG